MTYAGQVLLASCRFPLLEACRALLAKGITGRLELWRAGNVSWDVAVDIEAGAAWTVIETPIRGPVLGPYRTFAREEDEEDEDAAVLIG